MRDQVDIVQVISWNGASPHSSERLCSTPRHDLLTLPLQTMANATTSPQFAAHNQIRRLGSTDAHTSHGWRSPPTLLVPFVMGIPFSSCNHKSDLYALSFCSLVKPSRYIFHDGDLFDG